MAREEMELGTTKSSKVSQGWRAVWTWLIVAVVVTFAVSSISYDMGQDSRQSDLVRTQEQLKASEELAGRYKDARDNAQDKALVCTRALDASMHELAFKGDVLYDVYLSDGDAEKVERAKARVQNWYEDRDAVQERLDKGVHDCTGR